MCGGGGRQAFTPCSEREQDREGGGGREKEGMCQQHAVAAALPDYIRVVTYAYEILLAILCQTVVDMH